MALAARAAGCLAREGADLVLIDLDAEAVERAAETVRAAWTAERIALAGRLHVGRAGRGRRRRGARGLRADRHPLQQCGAERARAGERVLVARIRKSWRFVIEVSLLTAHAVLAPRGGRKCASGDAARSSTCRRSRRSIGDVGLVDYCGRQDGGGRIHAFARPRAGAVPDQRQRRCVRARSAPARTTVCRHEVIDKVRSSVPMGYVAEPDDVGNVVAFLASEDCPLHHRPVDPDRWRPLDDLAGRFEGDEPAGRDRRGADSRHAQRRSCSIRPAHEFWRVSSERRRISPVELVGQVLDADRRAAAEAQRLHHARRPDGRGPTQGRQRTR